MYRYSTLVAFLFSEGGVTFFGFWTIRGDRLEGDENGQTKFGAVATGAISFFIDELGHKTQFATIALATRLPSNSVGILIGMTTGAL